MGRPLNKKYFQGGSGFTIGCFYHDGTSLVESVIVRQRSNRIYDVLGSTGTALANDYTSLAFADANPDTIVRTGGTAFDADAAAPAPGDFIRIEGSENTGENDGVYEIASVTATTITLTADAALVGNTADTTATIEIVSASDVVRGKLVETAAALGEMHVVVTPAVNAATKAKLINAHQVKCYDDTTYVWNDTGPTDFRAQFEEADLQAASS